MSVSLANPFPRGFRVTPEFIFRQNSDLRFTNTPFRCGLNRVAQTMPNYFVADPAGYIALFDVPVDRSHVDYPILEFGDVQVMVLRPTGFRP